MKAKFKFAILGVLIALSLTFMGALESPHLRSAILLDGATHNMTSSIVAYGSAIEKMTFNVSLGAGNTVVLTPQIWDGATWVSENDITDSGTHAYPLLLGSAVRIILSDCDGAGCNVTVTWWAVVP